MNPMTPERLAEIKARCDAATPGPVVVVERGTHYDYDIAAGPDIEKQYGFYGYSRGMFWHEADAQFYAHAREDVPDLVAEIERLRVEVDGETWCSGYRERIAALEHSYEEAMHHLRIESQQATSATNEVVRLRKALTNIADYGLSLDPTVTACTAALMAKAALEET